jgi:NDP-sugar pyrophosphorylase family protein
MKAMVFAAGLGTRLRPFTDDRPKALVTVAGRTLLDITLSRLRTFGVREVIVNVHHFADQIVAYLAANRNFGMRIEVSREESLLDTGGGLKKAAWFFLDGKSPDDPTLQPFILHNVDIVSTIDIDRLAAAQRAGNALSTFAVQDRETVRYLLFDEQGILCGRRNGRDGPVKLVRPVASQHALAFSCIHVVSPRIFAKLTEEGAFSIIDAYLRLVAQGEKIASLRADGAYWRDLGRPNDLIAAERDVADGTYPAIK